MPHEAFLKAMGNIKDEPGKYESLKKAGHSLINALYFLCQLAWRKKTDSKRVERIHNIQPSKGGRIGYIDLMTYS